MDRLTKEQRSKNMKAIKGKDTKPELLLRKALWKRGFRGFRKNYKKLPWNPDIVFTKHKLAIFVDGEFWHGKDWEVRKNDIKSNRDFWIAKIERNMERDREVNEKLKALGWTVLRFWGKEVEKGVEGCVEEIKLIFK